MNKPKKGTENGYIEYYNINKCREIEKHIINLSYSSIVGEVRSTNIEHTHVIKISNKEINYIGQPEPEP
jgi:hypothetical protein